MIFTPSWSNKMAAESKIELKSVKLAFTDAKSSLTKDTNELDTDWQDCKETKMLPSIKEEDWRQP